MIPDFLRRENRKNDPEGEKMMEAIEKYENHFGEGLNTEDYMWSQKEWVEIINICIQQNKTLDEFLEIEYDSEDDV